MAYFKRLLVGLQLKVKHLNNGKYNARTRILAKHSRAKLENSKDALFVDHNWMKQFDKRHAH